MPGHPRSLFLVARWWPSRLVSSRKESFSSTWVVGPGPLAPRAAPSQEQRAGLCHGLGSTRAHSSGDAGPLQATWAERWPEGTAPPVREREGVRCKNPQVPLLGVDGSNSGNHTTRHKREGGIARVRVSWLVLSHFPKETKRLGLLLS